MRKYSVIPVTSREKVLYQLLCKEVVSLRSIFLNIGPVVRLLVSDLKSVHNLTLSEKKVDRDTWITLVSHQKGFALYQKWCSDRQDKEYFEDLVWLQYHEAGELKINLVREHKKTFRQIGYIIEKKENKLAQVTEKL